MWQNIFQWFYLTKGYVRVLWLTLETFLLSWKFVQNKKQLAPRKPGSVGVTLCDMSFACAGQHSSYSHPARQTLTLHPPHSRFSGNIAFPCDPGRGLYLSWTLFLHL